VENVDKLRELQVRVWEHFLEGKGGDVDGESGEERRLGAPVECDEPGKENSGKLLFVFFSFVFGKLFLRWVAWWYLPVAGIVFR